MELGRRCEMPEKEFSCRMVIQSQNHVVRSQWRHTKVVTTDLEILKQGRTNVRVLGFIGSDNRFFVCRVLGHDVYERLLRSRTCPQKKDFPLSCFTEWVPPSDDASDAIADAESPYEMLINQNAELKSELEFTAAKARIADERKGECIELRKKVSGLRSEIRDSQSDRDRLREENGELSRSLRAAESRIEELKARYAKAQESARDEKGNLDRIVGDLRLQLQEANARLEAESARGFWGRLARLFRPMK